MKVGIVGSGYVGATLGYALVLQGVGREIVLVDKNAARAAAEADDIRHAVPFAHPLTVRAGEFAGRKGRVVSIDRATRYATVRLTDATPLRRYQLTVPFDELTFET